ncbi:hypothetical protein BX589_1271, partial [Paraburkholderia fungorum]
CLVHFGVHHNLVDTKLPISQSSVENGSREALTDMPEVDILIVQGDMAKPGGVGELSSPSVAPAVANAVFRLTGTRVRETPFELDKVAVEGMGGGKGTG